MLKGTMLFLFLLLSPHILKSDWRPILIVWNVGQGQWITRVDQWECLQFDVGGERAPLNQVHRLCQGKSQSLWLSHWDLDHMVFASRLQRRMPRLCAMGWPLGKISGKKRAVKDSIPLCLKPSPLAEWISEPKSRPTANAFSRVAVTENWLIPGDAPAREEATWPQPRLKSIRILVAGHHGSRTSTSENLLQRLPNLRQAVISARQRRYGHPHSETLMRLFRHGVASITTETWGNIWFALD